MNYLKLKRRFYQLLISCRYFLYIALAISLIFLLIWLVPKSSAAIKKLVRIPSAIVALINPSIDDLESYKQRTNFLVLGIGGGDHPGSDLTDSIMLISIDLHSGDTVIISLPRDIWVESLSAKLNSAYHFGEQNQPGGGLIMAKSAVSEIIGQPIHYGAIVDFSGFEKAIDIIGGITVNVPHGFVDEQYPIPGKENAEPESERYQRIEFLPGIQHMDGAIALKYVRSRHAGGEEGTDYARSQRQQRIILSLKDQFLSYKTLLNFQKLKELRQTFSQSVITDIPPNSLLDLFKLAIRVDQKNIRTGIIDQGSQSEDVPALLYNPPVSQYGQWVLLPVNNDWQPIFDYINTVLYQNSTSKSS